MAGGHMKHLMQRASKAARLQLQVTNLSSFCFLLFYCEQICMPFVTVLLLVNIVYNEMRVNLLLAHQIDYVGENGVAYPVFHKSHILKKGS